MKKLIVCVIAALVLKCNAEDWKIQEYVDEMTDAVTYDVWKFGDVVRASDVLEYVPRFVVRVVPAGVSKSGGMKYRADPHFQIKLDGLKRNQCIVTSRFDRAPAEEAVWLTSTDRHAAFAPKAMNFTSRMLSATNLYIRFESTLGAIRTLRFDVRGLMPVMRNVKERYLKRVGKWSAGPSWSF